MMATLAQAEGDIRAIVKCIRCQQVSIQPFRLTDVPATDDQFIYITNCCENKTLHCSHCAVELPPSYATLKAARLRCRYKQHCDQQHNNTVRENFVSEVMKGFTTAHDNDDPDNLDHSSAGSEPDIPSDSVSNILSDSVPNILSDFVANDDADDGGDPGSGLQLDWLYDNDNEGNGEDADLLLIKGVTNGTDQPSLYKSQQQPSQDQLHAMFPNWTDGDIAEQVDDERCYGDHPQHDMLLKVFPETIDENLRVNGIGALLPKDSFLPTETKKQATKLYGILMQMLYRGKRLTRTNQKKLVQVIQTSLDVGMNAVALLKNSNADLKQSANVLEKNIHVFENILVSIYAYRCLLYSVYPFSVVFCCIP